MKYLSVCSGIEAASVAWHPLGWEPVAFSEIEPFPSAVLAHHYPSVPNWGDMTRFEEWPDADVDVLVGGTPCQSFSVAGLRKGLRDPRGNLMLTYGAIARRYRPRWLVWENVPGVLSSDGGRDFGTFLGMLGELGYGFAYRVLDAQYVRVDSHARAVPQRRRRVFVVGCLGDWRGAAAVLFERESLSGHPAPRREAGKGAAGRVAERAGSGGRVADVAATLNAHYGEKLGLENQHIDQGAPLFVAHSLRADGFDASEDGTGRGTPIVPVVAFDWKKGNDANNPRPSTMNPTEEYTGTLGATREPAVCYPVAIQERAVSENPDAGPDGAGIRTDGPAYTLESRTQPQAVAVAPALTASNDPSRSPQSSEVTQQVEAVHAATMAVRRLTPRECERLQGFPDDYTAIPWRKGEGVGVSFEGVLMMRGKRLREPTTAYCPDGPRYKALGNSMAVNCMSWIGQRIALIESIQDSNQSEAA